MYWTEGKVKQGYIGVQDALMVFSAYYYPLDLPLQTHRRGGKGRPQSGGGRVAKKGGLSLNDYSGGVNQMGVLSQCLLLRVAQKGGVSLSSPVHI